LYLTGITVGYISKKGPHPKVRKSRKGFADNNDPPQPN
jgi:hypothetical protein